MTYGPKPGNARTPSGLAGRVGGTAQKNGIVIQAAKSRTSRVKRDRECVAARRHAGGGAGPSGADVVGTDDGSCVDGGGRVDFGRECAVDGVRKGVRPHRAPVAEAVAGVEPERAGSSACETVGSAAATSGISR